MASRSTTTMSRLSASPAREKMDANTMLHQLMKRVEVARRAKSAQLNDTRPAHDEEVVRRREEILRDSKAAQLLREIREKEEIEERKRRRAAEEQRKEAARSQLYQEFEEKRRLTHESRSSWKVDAALEHEFDEKSQSVRRQTVRELRDEMQRLRQDAADKLYREREAAHARRLQEKRENRDQMERLQVERQTQVQSCVKAVRHVAEAKQQAIEAVYNRNRQSRLQVVSMNEALRRRELADIADQMEQLQRELNQLSH